MGEYRYHRPFPAYFNLRSNALLATDGALGHFTEVLSGDYYQSFSTSSPHQIWSAAMVISPILHGMFDLHTDAEKCEITLAPHLPADWTSFSIHNVRVGQAGVDFQYRKTIDSATLEVKRTGSGTCSVDFDPAFNLRTEIASVELNGRRLPFQLQENATDKHVLVRFPLSESLNTVTMRLKKDFGLAFTSELPPLGSTSRSLRILSETWNSARTQLEMELSGRAGSMYQFSVWNPGEILSTDGATLSKAGSLDIRLPDGPAETYVQHKVTIHFARP